MFPSDITTFETKQDLQPSDGQWVAEYQLAVQAGDFATANEILTLHIGSNKIINANYFNTITQVVVELEKYYLQRYSPAYVVSASRPAAQAKGDFWFQITNGG